MNRPSTLLLVLAAVVAMSQPAAAQYTCQSVVTRFDTDPDGSLLKRFRKATSINDSGDMLFMVRPIGEKTRLYLYPSVGAPSIVAEGGGTAVLPGAVFTSNPFDFPSLNDSSDLAFRGELVSQGQAIYVRPSAGSLAVAAKTTDASPAGGTFDDFPIVAETNGAGSVAFVGTALGGPTAVFTYDIPGGGPVTTAVTIGDTTTSGREICDIESVDYADGGDMALLASTKVLCSDGGETALDTIIHVSGATLTEVVKVGDATPIGGTTYASFGLPPQTNVEGDVLFKTKLTGVISSEALLLWDGVTESVLIVQGDFSPETGGSYRRIVDIGLGNGSKVFVKARFKGTTTKEAILRMDPPATTTVVVTKSDPPPSPPYAAGAAYRKLGRLMSVSHDGTDVGFVPKVRDTVPPKGTVGVVRCGSPSGAFLDGEAFL